MLSFDFEVLRRLVKFTIRRSREDRIPQVASSLTFTTVLSVVPLVTVGFAIFTAFPMFSSFQVALQGFLADHLMPAQVSIQIFKYLDQFVSKAKGLTTAGLLVLGVTAVMTMMTIESVFNVIWRVRKSRPLTQRVLVYWSIITLGPILFGLSLSISSFVLTESANWSGSLGAAAAGSAHQMGPMMALGLTGTALPLTILAYTLLYVYLPNCRVEWRDAVIGAVLAGLGFELARHGFWHVYAQVPDLYRGVRRVRDAADFPDLGVSELADYVAGRHRGFAAAGNSSRGIPARFLRRR